MLDDFMGRLIHMCYGKTWSTKFGGALAMLILGGKYELMTNQNLLNKLNLSRNIPSPGLSPPHISGSAGSMTGFPYLLSWFI